MPKVRMESGKEGFIIAEPRGTKIFNDLPLIIWKLSGTTFFSRNHWSEGTFYRLNFCNFVLDGFLMNMPFHWILTIFNWFCLHIADGFRFRAPMGSTQVRPKTCRPKWRIQEQPKRNRLTFWLFLNPPFQHSVKAKPTRTDRETAF